MHLKIFLSVLMTSLLAQLTVAQGFSGSVVDAKSGKGIEGAKIEIKDLGLQATTDSEGGFTFNKVSGEFMVSVYAEGYHTKSISINGESNHQLIELSATDQKLDEVVVSVPGGTVQKAIPVHVEVADIQELKSIPSSNMGDLIRNIPGVENAAGGPGVSKPVIRGLSGNRVVSVLNGMRIENQQWGGDHGMGVTDLGIGRVEVIKGPASLLYGSDALGGVIYFKDDLIKTGDDFKLRTESQFESASMGLVNNVWIQKRKGRFHVNAGMRINEQADYQVADGRFAANTRFNERVGKLFMGYGKEKWYTTLNYSYFNSKVGIPGAHEHEGEESGELLMDVQEREFETPFQFYQNHYISSETRIYTSKGKYSILLGHTIADLAEYEESLTLAAMSSRLSNSLLNFSWDGKLNKNVRVVLGYQGMLQFNRNDQEVEEILVSDANQLDNGLFSLLTWSKGIWNWQGGARFDMRMLEAYPETGAEKYLFTAGNFAVGGSRAIGRGVSRFNISSGVRMPHLAEMFTDGEHHGTMRYEIGNRGLKPEKGIQLDLSHEQSGEHIGFIMNPFFSLFGDYIYLKNLDSIIEELPVYQYEQMDLMIMTGGETGIHYHPHFLHGLHWESTLSVVFAEGLNGPLNFIPQSRLTNSIKIKIPFSENLALNDLVIQHYYYLPQHRVGEFETASVDYHIINIGANMRLETKFNIDVGVGVKNVLNENYINHLSRLKAQGIPNMGRNYYVSIRLEF